MHGGSGDLAGKLRFREGVSLEQLKLALNLGWTPEEMERAVLARMDYSTVASLIGAWDTSEHICIDGSNEEIKPKPGAHLALVHDKQILLHTLRKEVDAGSELTLTCFSFGADPVAIREVSSDSPLVQVQALPRKPLSTRTKSEVVLRIADSAAGTIRSTVHVRSTAGERHIQLQLHVRAKGPRLETHADTHNLGGTAIGLESTHRDFISLVNVGSSDLVIRDLALECNQPATLALQAPPALPLVLKPGGTQKLTLTSRLENVGLTRVLLHVQSNDDDSASTHVPFVLTGTQGPVHWGDDFIAMVLRGNDGDQVLRTRSDDAGRFELNLPPAAYYRVTYYDPVTDLVAVSRGKSADAGFETRLRTPWFQASAAPDTDRDGLPDDIELALGTDPTTADTDGDGRDDFLEHVTRRRTGGTQAPSDARLANAEPDKHKWLDAVSRDVRPALGVNMSETEIPRVSGAPVMRLFQIKDANPDLAALFKKLEAHVTAQGGEIVEKQVIGSHAYVMTVKRLRAAGLEATAEFQLMGPNLVIHVQDS